MKKSYLFIAAMLFLCSALLAQEIKPDASYYGVGFWTPDTLGNHRVVLSVSEKAEIVKAEIPWRRRDKNPEKKGLVLIDEIGRAHV